MLSGLDNSSSTSRFSLSPLQDDNEKWEILSVLPPSTSGIYRLFKAQKGGRIFILKALSEQYATVIAYQQLLVKEYQLGMLLNHQGVARTFGLETVATVGQCIVMEYVDGPTLREYLSDHTLSRREAETILTRVCEALSYIHACQVVHLDLKPSNIMIIGRGSVIKIIDFGFSDSPAFTRLKAVGSTRMYAAPELTESPEDVDNRADIYSLGVIMKQLLPRSDRAWHRVAARCCHPLPSCRPSDAHDIPLLLSSTRRRNRLTAILSSLAITSILTVGIIMIYPQLNPQSADRPAQSALQSPSATHDSLSASPDTASIPVAPTALPFDSDAVRPAIAPEESLTDTPNDLIENQIYARALQAAQVRWAENLDKLDTLHHQRTLDLCYVGYWRHLAKEDVARWLKTKMPAESPAFNQMMQIAAQTITQYGENPDRQGEQSARLLRLYKRTGLAGYTPYIRSRLPDGRIRYDSLMEDGYYYTEVAVPEEETAKGVARRLRQQDR